MKYSFNWNTRKQGNFYTPINPSFHITTFPTCLKAFFIVTIKPQCFATWLNGEVHVYGGEIAPKVGGILHILTGENFLPPLTNQCFCTPCDLCMFRFTITSPCTWQWVKPTYWRHSQNACRVESMNIVSRGLLHMGSQSQ
jgi:hypothetical protein